MISDLAKHYHTLGALPPDFLVYSATATTFTTTFAGATTTLTCGSNSSTRASGVAHGLSIPAGWSSVYVTEGKELVTSYNTNGNALVREIRFEKDYAKLVSVNVISSNNLIVLSLQNCPALTTISGVSNTKSTFYGNNNLLEVILSNCPVFTDVSLQGKFTNLDWLRPVASSLRTVAIRRNSYLTSANLSNFDTLTSVSFTGNYQSTNFACTNLIILDISNTPVAGVSIYGCNGLTTLDCTNCTALTTVNGLLQYSTTLMGSNALRYVTLTGCVSLTTFRTTGGGPDLTWLQPVSSTLVSLVIYGNTSTLSVDLSGFSALSSITFGGSCSGKTARWGCTSLRTLNLDGSAIISASVYGCSLLNTIIASNCPRLTTIMGYNVTDSTGSLNSLSVLDLTNSLAFRTVMAHLSPDINLTLDNCDYTTLWFNSGNKSSANINEILAKCVAIAPHITSTPSLTLTGNAAPTDQGLIDKATLINQYGWMVATA